MGAILGTILAQRNGLRVGSHDSLFSSLCRLKWLCLATLNKIQNCFTW